MRQSGCFNVNLVFFFLISLGLTLSCGKRSGNNNLQVLESGQNKTSNMVITDSAATQTTGVKVGKVYLTPDRKILDNLKLTSELHYFQKLITEAGLTEAFSNEGPFTFFVPSRQAFQKSKINFDKLPADEKKEFLHKLIEYHIVIGKLMADDLADNAVMITGNGYRLRIQQSKNKIFIDRAIITTPDIVSQNGVVHVVDRLLYPE